MLESGSNPTGSMMFALPDVIASQLALKHHNSDTIWSSSLLVIVVIQSKALENVVVMFLLQLYFIGSATSFYFVYDFCLYDGMTTLGGSALAYLPLLTAAATLLPLLGLKLW